MKAFGEHILIKKPNKKTVTDSGLMLPDTMGVQYEYGLVVSSGDESGVKEGDYVLYDGMGTREVCIDPMRDDGLMVAHKTHIFAVLSKEDLVDRKLPIPKP